MKWTFAKTYAKTAPHEWIVKEKEPELFRFIQRRIKGHGVWEDFAMPGKKPHRVKILVSRQIQILGYNEYIEQNPSWLEVS